MTVPTEGLIRTSKTAHPRHYLLAPSEPTPNGRLHLGHIAGPFLRLDMLSRFLRMRGDLPLIITGSDVYEPYMTFKAVAEGRSEAEIAAEYDALIAEDLSAVDIGVDQFINPCEDPWRKVFEEEVDACVRRLRHRGAVVEQRERVPYSRSAARYIVGPWLTGGCPDCGSRVSSYFCETCGGHFRPENLLEPQGPDGAGPLEWREISSLFLRVAEPEPLRRRMAEMRVPPRFQEAVERFLAREGGTVRLSAPQQWGVALEGGVPGVPRTLFSYAGIFMFARLMGAVHGEMSGTGVNAFDPGSGVTTVTSFGIDNVIPTMVCIVGTALRHGDMKGYDRVLVNDFYQLEGEKFSTSRGHVIWSADIARAPRISADAVRYFLAGTRLEEGPESMEPRSFVEVNNTRLAGRLTSLVRAASAVSADVLPEPMGQDRLARLEELLRRQETALDGLVIATADAVAAFDLWWRETPGEWGSASQAYWWLKGVAVLAFPIMPRLGRRLWESLGGTGEPRLAAFLEPTRPRASGGPGGFEPITLGDLVSVLPVSSRHVPA
ncbi:class I tRNA ligase family protein [Streptosporangium sp. NPDC020072]|uniref:class I tRNA ligase family protein n=1 Tax=Streptosporangium sp. NPDC020072 TaxID=3154788 RepID=UPI0034305FCB